MMIFVIQLWLFTLIALGLHYSSPRIGSAPIIFFTGGIIGLLNIIELNSLIVTITEGITLRPGGHVLVPIVLLVILVLYVSNGTRTAQIALEGVIGVNVFVFLVLGFITLYVTFVSEGTAISGTFAESTQFNHTFMRGMLSSLVAFIADMLIIIIVYQGIHNTFSGLFPWIAPTIALLVALWTDTAIFNLLSYVGTSAFTDNVAGDILMKTLAALLIMPLSALYFTRFAPQLPQFVGTDKRRTFDIFYQNGASQRQLDTLEDELRISRAIYAQITQHIEEVFWLFDIETQQILYISPAYERITQRSVDPLYKKPEMVLDFFHPEDRHLVVDAYQKLLTVTGIPDVECRYLLPNGNIRWACLRSFPILSENGTILRLAGVVDDITDRKRLTEQSLSLQLAEERVRILNDFVQDASHDLKTPLSAMILKIALLKRINNETRRQTLYDEIKDRAKHLSDLIDDLFTLSRLEGYHRLECQMLNFNQLVETVCDHVRPLATEKQLIFRIELAQMTNDIEGDPDQLQRLISNLVSNAIRYTKRGHVYVRTQMQSNQCILSVADSGIGIDEALHDKIFNRFFRSDPAREMVEGTGLGLAIAKAIVDRHQGKITVKNNESGGTTFTVQLPYRQVRSNRQNEAHYHSMQEMNQINAVESQ